MISITVLIWISVVFFFVLGIRRGWRNELLSSGTIILAFVSIFQLDGWLRNHILRFASMTHIFVVETIILVVLFFLSHLFLRSIVQPTTNISTKWRSFVLTSLLGGVIGGANGYLFAASIWYFLDINLYPFSPYISAPIPGTSTALAIENLPVLGLTGGPTEILIVGIVITLLIVFL